MFSAGRQRAEAKCRPSRTTPNSHDSFAAEAPAEDQSSPPPGSCYTSDTYRRAIERAADKAFPAPTDLPKNGHEQWKRQDRWAPNRLRHTAATEIRRAYRLEGSQVVLGHARATSASYMLSVIWNGPLES